MTRYRVQLVVEAASPADALMVFLYPDGEPSPATIHEASVVTE